MGKLQSFGRAELEEAEEEEARWAVQRACECVEEGDLEGALSLLERAERLHPSARGLPEILAVTEVCYAANWSPCACSPSLQQHKSPQWYRILKVSEKADLNTIKKRYRQLALLLHPDKNKHVRAEEAFKLVSEAYAHLSDRNKRAIFDFEMRKRQCKKCSSMSQPQIDSRDSMRCYREFLKGKNQTNFQRCYFPSDFHTAEWKMEHEKLRMFRERAQAKVDSLAQILKERRSRWNEEMGTTKRRYQKTSVCSMDQGVYKSDIIDQIRVCMEGGAYKSQSLEQLHQCGRARKELAKDANGSSLNSDYSKLSQILQEGGGLSLVGKHLLEELRSRKSREKETPQMLQSLDGLLGILREEIGGSNGSMKGEDAKPRDGKRFGLGDEVRMAEGNNINNVMHQCREGCSSTSKHKSGDKLEEELMVIDDFLAGLSEFLPENHKKETATTDLNFKEAEEKASMCASSMQCEISVKNVGRTSHSSARNYMNKYMHETESWESLQEPLPARNTNASASMSNEYLSEQKNQIGRGVAKKYTVAPSVAKQSATASSQADRVVYPRFSTLLNNEMGSRSSGGNVSWNDPMLPLNDSVHRNIPTNTSGISADKEENILQSQKKKSEQLLRTLECLRREETQSVAATLETMKDHVASESHHMGGIFPGSCRVPAAASIIAT